MFSAASGTILPVTRGMCSWGIPYMCCMCFIVVLRLWLLWDCWWVSLASELAGWEAWLWLLWAHSYAGLVPSMTGCDVQLQLLWAWWCVGWTPPKQEPFWGATAGAGQCYPRSGKGWEPFWRGLLGQPYWAGLVLRRKPGQGVWC